MSRRDRSVTPTLNATRATRTVVGDSLSMPQLHKLSLTVMLLSRVRRLNKTISRNMLKADPSGLRQDVQVAQKKWQMTVVSLTCRVRAVCRGSGERLNPLEGRSRPTLIEGYAIVSADSMIADAGGAMDALKFDADQQLFWASLDAAAAVAHGRHSAEGGPRVDRRRRLILTRRIAGLAHDPQNSKALLWNPSGASFEDAWRALGAPDGALAVIGGTDVFGLFLEIGYDSFHLSRARNVRLPGGRPLFPRLQHEITPEEMLARHGLKPGTEQILDAIAGVTLVTWVR